MPQQQTPLFEFKNIHVSVEDKKIVKGVSLALHPGEKHAIMGPNGSGKSSLTNALMGHPNYEITEGSIYMNGEDITGLAPDERAQKGLFLGMQ
ncbi:ATP-binding cassette domain-containing protein, partial [candidate division KSB1 bacterium]